MRKTTYIHIGLHKTGSTAIQFFLSRNKDLLLSMGYNYLNFTIPASHFISVACGFGHGESNPNYLVKECNTSNEEVIEEFKKSVKEYNTILSSEIFVEHSSISKFHKLRSLCNGSDIKIIAYLRRQDKYVESAFNHQYRMGNTESKDTYLKGYPLPSGDYCAILNQITEVFGKENIIIRPYEKEQFIDGSLFVDFLDQLGVEHKEAFNYITSKINPAMKYEYTHVFNICTRNGVDFKDLFWLLSKNDVNLSINPDDKKYSFLSPGEQNKILEYWNKCNRMIARDYLGRENGQLFFEKYPEESDGWNPAPDLNIENILPEFAKIMLKQNKDIERLKLQLQESYIKHKDEAFNLFKEGEVLFNLQKDENSRLLKNQRHINAVSYNSKKELIIDADGLDPSLLLKIEKLDRFRILRLEFDIEPPESTVFQVFYKYKKEEQFSEKNSSKHQLSVGNNNVVMYLNKPVFDMIRIDPGNIAGRYIIRNMKIEA